MGRYATAARAARDLTNKQLATEIAAIGPIPRDKLQELLPLKADKEAFLELMRQVESEKSDDEKLAFLGENLQTVGRVALKALAFLV